MNDRTRRWWVALVALVLVMGACGGGDDGDASPTTTAAPGGSTTAAPTTTQGTGDTTAATTAAPTTTTTEASGGGGDVNMATVTIGDKTYVFDVEASIVGRCDPDFFGAFWVIASMADGSPGGLEMLIIPEGNTNHNETSRITVGVEETDGRDWHADEDGGQGAEAGVSRVESASIDGNTVTGTATFIDTYSGDDATAEGTFTATCP